MPLGSRFQHVPTPALSSLAERGLRGNDGSMNRELFILMGSLQLVMLCCPLKAAPQSKDLPKEQGMLDRIMHPDRNAMSAFDSKVFNTSGSFSDRKVSTREYAGSKAFTSKEFVTKSYEGEKKSWLGNLLFPSKKLPENLQGTSAEASKRFSSKELPSKEYAELDKKSSLGSKVAYETKEISLKGKTQGAIDNDPHLQEAVKKGLSVEDVRKLLNKAP